MRWRSAFSLWFWTFALLGCVHREERFRPSLIRLAQPRCVVQEPNQVAVRVQAILLCAYGARAFEDTLAELRDVAVKSGFRVIAALAAVTEHSVVRTIAAGRPDARDRALLQSFALDIHRKLSAGDLSEPAIPGNRPYKDGLKRPMIPEAGPGCTGCGACAKACPAQAIDREDPKKTDPEACASCMRCVLVCPSRARRLPEAVYASSKAMLEKACEGHKDCQLFL